MIFKFKNYKEIQHKLFFTFHIISLDYDFKYADDGLIVETKDNYYDNFIKLLFGEYIDNDEKITIAENSNYTTYDKNVDTNYMKDAFENAKNQINKQIKCKSAIENLKSFEIEHNKKILLQCPELSRGIFITESLFVDFLNHVKTYFDLDTLIDELKSIEISELRCIIYNTEHLKVFERIYKYIDEAIEKESYINIERDVK
jgi:hypothetical protein